MSQKERSWHDTQLFAPLKHDILNLKNSLSCFYQLSTSMEKNKLFSMNSSNVFILLWNETQR